MKKKLIILSVIALLLVGTLTTLGGPSPEPWGGTTPIPTTTQLG